MLNKMKKNVDSMGSNKLMNYQNLFNEAYTQITKDIIFDSLDFNVPSISK